MNIILLELLWTLEMSVMPSGMTNLDSQQHGGIHIGEVLVEADQVPKLVNKGEEHVYWLGL